MSNSHLPSSNPPPLPGEQRSKQASAQANQTQPNGKKQKPKQRSGLAWLWVLLLLMGGAGGYWALKYQIAQQAMYGFQAPEMAMARYTPKDVIGDLGGLKVSIPEFYIENLEYDGDSGWKKGGESVVPKRTFDSKIKSFGISVYFPEMIGLENARVWEDRRRSYLNPYAKWIRISIISGEAYPGLGENARHERAKSLLIESKYWWESYERLHEDMYDLEMYVVKGVHPKTGGLARESGDTEDIYIHRDRSGHVNTYIKCGRPAVPEGVGNCSLQFGLEPAAKVEVTVSFRPYLLPRWREVQESVRSFLLGFEVRLDKDK